MRQDDNIEVHVKQYRSSLKRMSGLALANHYNATMDGRQNIDDLPATAKYERAMYAALDLEVSCRLRQTGGC